MPSCTRAPPESLMNTNGEPVFSACSMTSATLMECTSPAAPPITVKSWLARWIRRPPTDAAPVTTPSAGRLLPSMPNMVARCSANRPFSSKLDGSTSASMRSRAVSLPDWRCFSSLSAPPPSITASRRRFNSSIFSCIAVVVIFRALVVLASSIPVLLRAALLYAGDTVTLWVWPFSFTS